MNGTGTNSEAVYETVNEYCTIAPEHVATALSRAMVHINPESRDGVYDVIEAIHEADDDEINRRTGNQYPYPPNSQQ